MLDEFSIGGGLVMITNTTYALDQEGFDSINFVFLLEMNFQFIFSCTNRGTIKNKNIFVMSKFTL